MTSKLLRLTTLSDDAVFNATYDDTVVLKAGSQVALHSTSFKTSGTIIIDGFHNDIEFQAMDGGFERVGYLTPGQYSAGNIRELLLDIQNTMNKASRQAASKEFGLQYKVAFNQDDRVEFNALQSDVKSAANDFVPGDPEPRPFFTYKNIERDAAFNIGGSSDPNPLGIDLNHIVVYSQLPFVKGCGTHRLKIANMETGAQNGLCIGLTKNINALHGRFLVDADIECAINITDRGGRYNIKTSAEGAFTPSGSAPGFIDGTLPGIDYQNNDMLELAMDNGVIKLLLHTGVGTDTKTQLGTYAYDFTTNPDLYPFICLFRDSDEIQIRETNVNLDPYIPPDRQLDNGTIHLQPGLTTVVNPPDVNANGQFKFTTRNKELSTLLGFPNNLLYDVENAADLYPQEYGILFNSPQGRRTFNLFSANNYLVELLDFPLESYDSFTNFNSGGSKRGRANIIAVVPVNENTGSSSTLGIVQYEPTNQHYISLSNVKDRLIRNIRCRIVNEDYSSINIIGMASIVLLIKSP